MLPCKRGDYNVRDLREVSRFLARMLGNEVRNYNIATCKDAFFRIRDIVDRLRDLGSNLKYDEVLAAVESATSSGSTSSAEADCSPSHIRAISGHTVLGVDDTLLLGPSMNMEVAPRVLYHGIILLS